MAPRSRTTTSRPSRASRSSSRRRWAGRSTSSARYVAASSTFCNAVQSRRSSRSSRSRGTTRRMRRSRGNDWMRGLRIPTLSGSEAAETWLELWRRVNRIWTIHFIVTGSAYPVMEELAQAYETLVGGNGTEALAITQGHAPTLQRLEHDLHALTEIARRVPIRA